GVAEEPGERAGLLLEEDLDAVGVALADAEELGVLEPGHVLHLGADLEEVAHGPAVDLHVEAEAGAEAGLEAEGRLLAHGRGDALLGEHPRVEAGEGLVRDEREELVVLPGGELEHGGLAEEALDLEARPEAEVA